jgi:hypothetical protein
MSTSKRSGGRQRCPSARAAAAALAEASSAEASSAALSIATRTGAKKYKGVGRCEDVGGCAGRWQARIKHLGKMKRLGTYDTQEMAAAAFDVAARGMEKPVNYQYNFKSLKVAKAIVDAYALATQKVTLTSATPGYTQFSHETLKDENGGAQIMYSPAIGGKSVCCHQRQIHRCKVCQPASYQKILQGNYAAASFHIGHSAGSAHNKRSREKEVCSIKCNSESCNTWLLLPSCTTASEIDIIKQKTFVYRCDACAKPGFIRYRNAF